MSRDPYRVLGVSSNMSEEEIHVVYRKLAKQYHTDMDGGDVTKFQEIQKAWSEIKKEKGLPKRVKCGVPTHISLFNFRRV